MLAVLFSLGSRRYGLDAATVERIVPAVPLRAAAAGQGQADGVFTYRGGPVPVVDLARLMGKAPSRIHLSTRIILVRNPAAGAARLLGLLAEQVNEVRHVAGLSSARPGAEDKMAPRIVSLEDLLPRDLLVTISNPVEVEAKSP